MKRSTLMTLLANLFLFLALLTFVFACYLLYIEYDNHVLVVTLLIISMMEASLSIYIKQ